MKERGNLHPDDDTLGKWAVFALKELERLSAIAEKRQEDIIALQVEIGKWSGIIEKTETEITTLARNGNVQKVDIAMLKVKSGIFGVIGGLLPALAVLLYMLLKKG